MTTPTPPPFFRPPSVVRMVFEGEMLSVTAAVQLHPSSPPFEMRLLVPFDEICPRWREEIASRLHAALTGTHPSSSTALPTLPPL